MVSRTRDRVSVRDRVRVRVGVCVRVRVRYRVMFSVSDQRISVQLILFHFFSFLSLRTHFQFIFRLFDSSFMSLSHARFNRAGPTDKRLRRLTG